MFLLSYFICMCVCVCVCTCQLRNKPRDPPKRPSSAPFFLPTVAGLEPSFELDGDASSRPADATSRIRSAASSAKPLLSEFGRALQDAARNQTCNFIFNQCYFSSNTSCDHSVDKASAVGQPFRPTQPSIPSGSVN